MLESVALKKLEVMQPAKSCGRSRNILASPAIAEPMLSNLKNVDSSEDAPLSGVLKILAVQLHRFSPALKNLESMSHAKVRGRLRNKCSYPE